MRSKHSPRARPAHGDVIQAAHDALPYRGVTGARRPDALAALALPPQPMAPLRRGRPLKAWRYVLFVAPDLIACAARVRIGLAPDTFWAVLDRRAGLFRSGRFGVDVGELRATVNTRRAELELHYPDAAGVETVCAAGAHYAWTAKRALPATANWRGRQLEGHVLIDDTAAYYERHTRWFWSAGVGRALTGEIVAWNLVSGVNDPPRDSERTIWVDGVAHEPPPNTFLADLSAVDGLRFSPEATLARHTELGLIRSDYRQPLGTFAGALAGGIELRDGLGVMERHDAWW